MLSLYLCFPARICSMHFHESCFEIPLKHKMLQYSPKTSRYLKLDAVPTLHLPGSGQKYENTDRQVRLVKRSQKGIVKDLLKESSSTEQAPEEPQPGPSSSYDEVTINVIEITSNNKDVSGTKNNE